MRQLFFATLLFCFSCVSAAQGDVVTSFVDFTAAADTDLTDGVNNGGFNTGSANAPFNGDDFLNLEVTIDDSAGTGAVFSAILTVSGNRRNGTTRVRHADDGKIQFANNNTFWQDTLTLTVGPATQVSGPAANIVFDGFSAVDLSNFGVAEDTFTFDSVTYDGVTHSNNIAFASLAASGSTFEDVGPASTPTYAWQIDGVSSQWTVAAVPEPNSVVLLAGGLIGLAGVRRRKKRKF